MRRSTRESAICHIALVLIMALALLCGWAVTKANAAPDTSQPPAWSLLAKTLGKDPNKADAVDLGIALKKALGERPDLLIPLVQTSAALACKLKYPRAVMLMVIQIAVDARQDRLVDIISAAHAVCPDGVRGVEEKIIVTPDYEPDLTPKWTPPELPPIQIFTPITPTQDIRPR